MRRGQLAAMLTLQRLFSSRAAVLAPVSASMASHSSAPCAEPGTATAPVVADSPSKKAKPKRGGRATRSNGVASDSNSVGSGRVERRRSPGTTPPSVLGKGYVEGLVSGGEAAARARTRHIPPTAYKSFNKVTSIHEFNKQFGHAKSDERLLESVRVAGRVGSIRDMGRMIFVTIHSNGVSLQVLCNVGSHYTQDALRQLKDSLHVGDVVGVEGQPGRTARGELTIFASVVSVLSPYVCADIVSCPDQRGFRALADNDLRYRYRFLDMISDTRTQQLFRARHVMLCALRQFLNDRGFVEVETPVLHQVASGANARPFTTHHNANDVDLHLRVAPELHLKQCVVGGMERVYEVGRVFRNEDADKSHNPEFTSCEFYAAYLTYEDLMDLTEELLRTLALAVNNSTLLEIVEPVNGRGPAVIDLAMPFRRVNVYDEIQRLSGVELPPANELGTPMGMAYMSLIMLQHRIPLPTIRTPAKMFDKLIDYFITDRAVDPVFVTAHPIFMSPLAKESEQRPGLSERFELFINGMEVCNAYSELNDPIEQLKRFESQLVDKQRGDDEAMPLDEVFLKALQVGLPPTGGWGMGVDRVLMLLTKATSIRDVIMFPLLRQDDASHDAKRRRRTAGFFGFNQQMTLFCLSALEEEMRKRGRSGQGYQHLQELRRVIVDMNQKQDALAEQLLRCQNERSAAQSAPCGLLLRLIQTLLGSRRA